MKNDDLRNVLIDNILKNIRYNTASYDKTILNLSSAILVTSVVFISEVIKLKDAAHLFLLYISWVSFLLTIFFSLLSFHVSNKGQEVELNFWYQYKDENVKDEHTSHKNEWINRTDWLNKLSGIFFFVALLSTITFMFFNLGRLNE